VAGGSHLVPLLFVVAAAMVSGCSRDPDTQAFGTAFPEPARNLTYVAGGRCSLDLASGTPSGRGWRTDTAKPIRFSGWALEDPSKPASDWIVIELAAPGDRALYFAVATFRNPLPDLAAGMGDGPGLRKAAFELVARADTLPRGRYAIRVLMKGGTGGLSCDIGSMTAGSASKPTSTVRAFGCAQRGFRSRSERASSDTRASGARTGRGATRCPSRQPGDRPSPRASASAARPQRRDTSA
jgi:hypothetical protein